MTNKPSWRSDWLAWYFVGVAVLVFLAALNVAYEVGKPFAYFPFVRNYSNNVFYNQDGLPWWPRIEGNGLIVQVNNEPTGDARVQARMFAEQFARGVDTIELEREYYGTYFSVTAPLVPISIGMTVEMYAAYFLNALTFWLLGWVV